MSLGPKPQPAARTGGELPPLVAPQPLALPDAGTSMGLGALRIGNRNGLKMAPAVPNLMVPKQ